MTRTLNLTRTLTPALTLTLTLTRWEALLRSCMQLVRLHHEMAAKMIALLEHSQGQRCLHHSLLTTHHSPLTIHYSLLTTDCSLLTAHY